MIPSLESLEAKAELAEMGTWEYRFAWAWAHFMLHGPLPAHRALVQFVNDLQRGQAPGQLSERLAEAIPDVEFQFVQHFKYWRRS
jgi:hypothetical protein